jgi:hypothetical protein
MILSTLDIALDYLTLNPERYLFPIEPLLKLPPKIRNNLVNASNDPAQITAWHKKWPGCNWGIALQKSRLLVVDVDTKAGKFGQDTYDELDLLYGFPKTESVRTPSGGFHYYYEGEHVFALGKRGFGLDIDSPNYVLLPGCSLQDGTTYQAIASPASVAAPAWFYDVIKKNRVKLTDSAEAAVDLDKPQNIAWAEDYLRNDAEPSIEGQGGEFTLFKVAASLRDNGISEATAVEMLNTIYNVPGLCEPEWEIEALTAKVANAYTYANQSQIGGKTAEADFGDDDVKQALASIPPEIMGNPKAEAERAADKAFDDKLEKAPPDEQEIYYERVRVRGDYVYVTGLDRFVEIAAPKTMWKKTQFDNHFGYLGKKGKSFADSLLTVKKGSIRKFKTMAFLPGQPKFIGNGTTFNCYVEPTVIPVEGDLTWWNDHLAYLFPNPIERDHVLNWMAWLLQNISRKPKHALLIQGPTQGTGKSFIAAMLRLILNPVNTTAVSQNDLHGQFNGWALRSKLVIIEELRAVDRNEVKNKLHDLITQETITINEKNIPVHETDNCFGIFAMTNDDAAISLDSTDRRYLVVRTDAVVRPKPYYVSLYNRLKDAASVAAVAYSLMNRKLGEYNGESSAPVTSAKEEMITAGLSDLEHWITENEGNWPFNGRIIQTADVIESLPPRLARSGGRLLPNISSILKRRFGARKAGQFRLSNGQRVRLFVINGSAIMNIAGWERTIVALYEKDKADADKPRADDDAAEEFGVGED